MEAFPTPPIADTTATAGDPPAPASSTPGLRGRERSDLLCKTFRRRDNIRHFVSGLEDSECWPYPQAQNGQSVSPTFGDDDEPTLIEVAVKPEMVQELTVLTLANVWESCPTVLGGSGPSGSGILVDVTIELSPEDGIGAYIIDHEPVENIESRTHTTKLDMYEVRLARSAFMHRYEWVANKIESVNQSRFEAWDTALTGESETEVESNHDPSIEPPSEEEDFDDNDDAAEDETDVEGEDDEQSLIANELQLGCNDIDGCRSSKDYCQCYHEAVKASAKVTTYETIDDIQHYRLRRDVAIMQELLPRESITSCMNALAKCRGGWENALDLLEVVDDLNDEVQGEPTELTTVKKAPKGLARLVDSSKSSSQQTARKATTTTQYGSAVKRAGSPKTDSGAKRQRRRDHVRALEAATHTASRATDFGDEQPEIEAEASGRDISFAIDWGCPSQAISELASSIQAVASVLKGVIENQD